MKKQTIQDLVRDHYTRWIAAGQHVLPNIEHCLMFINTEIAEAQDKYLRQQNYIRNNPGDVPTNLDIAIELFDVVMMCCMALDLLDTDLWTVALLKLAEMDEKRNDTNDY